MHPNTDEKEFTVLFKWQKKTKKNIDVKVVNRERSKERERTKEREKEREGQREREKGRERKRER